MLESILLIVITVGLVFLVLSMLCMVILVMCILEDEFDVFSNIVLLFRRAKERLCEMYRNHKSGKRGEEGSDSYDARNDGNPK